MRYTLGAKIGNCVVTQSCEAHHFILPFESSVKANAYRNFAVLFFNTGVQIGIIEDMGLFNEIGRTEGFLKKIRSSNAALHVHTWRKYYGRCTNIVAMKNNDFYCYFLSWQGRKRGRGDAPRKSLGLRNFHAWETPSLNRQGTAKSALSFFS